VTLSGGYGLATVGYLAVARSGWQVYPQVGVGLGGVSVEIGSADGANFDDVLDAPNREARLNRGQLLASLALHATYTLGAPEGASGFRIGLQVGYLFAPAHGDWTMGGHTLPGGPEAGLDGAFFRLLLGGGSLVQGGPSCQESAVVLDNQPNEQSAFQNERTVRLKSRRQRDVRDLTGHEGFRPCCGRKITSIPPPFETSTRQRSVRR